MSTRLLCGFLNFQFAVCRKIARNLQIVLWFYEGNKITCQTACFTPLCNENTLITFTAVGLQLVTRLPEEMCPGPDFHGLPWEPVILTALVGIVTLAIFFWRTCLSVSILHACKPADVSPSEWSFVWLNCFSITEVKAICSLLCFTFSV